MCSRRDNGNALFLLGAGGLGVSLYLIHIYVTPLKRFVQVSRAFLAFILIPDSKLVCLHSDASPLLQK